jgi:hypothetical protein
MERCDYNKLLYLPNSQRLVFHKLRYRKSTNKTNPLFICGQYCLLCLLEFCQDPVTVLLYLPYLFH